MRIGSEGPRRRPNEELTKDYLDWNGTRHVDYDGACVSANITSTSIYADPTADTVPTAASSTTADVATAEQQGFSKQGEGRGSGCRNWSSDHRERSRRRSRRSGSFPSPTEEGQPTQPVTL